MAFLLPPIILTVFALTRWSSPLAQNASSYLLTLWQVQATIAGGGIVLFVFLLQTVNLSRRTTATVLTLAKASGILLASTFGLATTLGTGIALALGTVHGSVTTYVLWAVGIAGALNVIIVLGVLLRTLSFLDGSTLAKLQRDQLLEQIKESTRLEATHATASNYMTKIIKGTKVGDFWDDFAARITPLYDLANVDPNRWELIARRKRMVFDVDLERVERVANSIESDAGKPSIIVHTAVGSVVQRGHVILSAATTPNLWDRLKLRRAFRWCPAPIEERDTLMQVSDEFQTAVSDGDIYRFREGIALCVAITEASLDTLKEMGLGYADGADSIEPINSVRDMLRHGLEEALKTGRADFALETRSALYNLTRAAVVANNAGALKGFLRLYPFVRRVVLRIGSSDPVYKDLYWHNLVEVTRLTVSSPATKDGHPSFVPTSLGLVEEAVVSMLKDAIEEQASDFDQLLDAHRLAFQYVESPRLRTSRRGAESLRAPDSGSHWVILAGWAVYLLQRGVIEAAFARKVLVALATRFGDNADLLIATVQAARREDADLSELVSWILSTKAEGIAHGLDSRTPVVVAFLSLCVLSGEPINARIALSVEDGHELAENVRRIVDGWEADTGPYRAIFEQLGLATGGPLEGLRTLRASFGEAKTAEEDRKNAQLRAAPIDEAEAERFELDVVQGYLRVSAVRALSEVFSVADEPLPDDPDARGIGHKQLLPKEIFVKGSGMFGAGSLAEQFAKEMDDGELHSHLEAIAAKTKSESVPYDVFLDRLIGLCDSGKHGVLFLKASGASLGLYRNPAFKPAGSDRAHRLQIGKLSDVPIVHAYSAKNFDAIYLPPNSVTVQYEAPTFEGRVFKSAIEVLTPERAEEIVAAWEKGGKSYSAKERVEEVERLQEKVRYSSFMRAQVAFENVVTLCMTDPPEDENE